MIGGTTYIILLGMIKRWTRYGEIDLRGKTQTNRLVLLVKKGGNIMDNIFKSISAAFGAILGYLFGEWSALLGILLAFVVTDYITGIIAAGLEGKLSSQVGFRGIAKKVIIFVIVAMGHLADNALGLESVLMSAAIFFYLANELISILENAGRIGLPVPGILEKAIALLKEKAGENKDVGNKEA